MVSRVKAPVAFIPTCLYPHSNWAGAQSQLFHQDQLQGVTLAICTHMLIMLTKKSAFRQFCCCFTVFHATVWHSWIIMNEEQRSKFLLDSWTLTIYELMIIAKFDVKMSTNQPTSLYAFLRSSNVGQHNLFSNLTPLTRATSCLRTGTPHQHTILRWTRKRYFNTYRNVATRCSKTCSVLANCSQSLVRNEPTNLVTKSSLWI